MSQTEKNLYEAFVGEAKASLRLWGFAERADQEGYQAVARLFRAIAAAARIHGVKHLRQLQVIGSTEENLEAAFESESTVSENVYPAMIAKAEEEGHQAAAVGFSHARDAEEVHAQLYKKVIGHMVAEEEPTYHVCKVCGYVVDGEPPDTCPVCGAPRKLFFEVE